MKGNPYRFPPNLRAEATDLRGQIAYVMDEADETFRAYATAEGDMRVIEEAWDVIQAAEGVLRKFPLHKVELGLGYVKLKSLKRGDYEIK